MISLLISKLHRVCAFWKRFDYSSRGPRAFGSKKNKLFSIAGNFIFHLDISQWWHKPNNRSSLSNSRPWQDTKIGLFVNVCTKYLKCSLKLWTLEGYGNWTSMNVEAIIHLKWITEFKFFRFALHPTERLIRHCKYS